MPKAKKNDYQDWNISSKDGPSPGDLGPRMVHEDPSSTPPNDDHELEKGLKYVLDDEIDVDVKEMVRRYEEHDIRDFPDGPERTPAINLNLKREQSDNQYRHEEENLGPSFQHEDQHENPTFQPEDDFPEPAPFQHEVPPLRDRLSNHMNRQKSDTLPPPPAYEFDAAAAREASKLQWSAERPNAPSANQRNHSDALPAVPTLDMTASRYDELQWCDRKSGGEYRSQKDSLPPVPGYDYGDDGDDIAAEKRKAAAKSADRRSWRSRARSRGNDMVDYVVTKTRSKANRTAVILIASGVLVIVIAILFMIIYFSTGHKSLPTVTVQPTDARPTDTGGSIVIVGVNLDATVRLSNRAFIPQYNNDLSSQYRSLADNFTNTMDAVFYGSDLSGVYNGTQVNGFSPGSVIVDFVIRLLSPPVTAPGDTTTPAGSIDDRIKKIEEDVQAAVQDVIEDAADDGSLDELGVDSTSFVVTDVGVDVRVITEAPTTIPPPETTQTQDATAPAISCPDDYVVYLETGESSANVTWPDLNATDDSGQVTVTTDISEGLWDAGDYTVVATATDPAGNSDQCSFNVTVRARTCPPGWLRRSESCYRLSWADPVPYEQALQLCSELDAIPFVPNSQAEFNFVIEFLGDLGLNFIWLGCDDTNEERKFDCLDGNRIRLQSSWWAPGQPNSYETENCIVLVLGAMNLHDYPCTYDRPRTLCEKV